MGFEDWENKYKRQGKPHISDFLDDEQDSVILRMGKPYLQPRHTSQSSDTQRRGFMPATYPEGYDTIDRRRKKKIRDPGGLSSAEANRRREKAFPSDLALLHEKRGQEEIMQEEEEHMTSCLKPYKNGLLYKAKMWAKNELDHTLENYVAYKKEQDARMRAQFDFDLESSEDLHYSVEPQEDIDIDDIAFIAENHPKNQKHCKDRYSFPSESRIENSQGIWERKCGKAKVGGWAPEAILSPVEEPSDEYVDPMDELQCLVETVSEYLAEKEEEISKYGSLPKSSKSRLSSLGSNRTDSFGEDKNSSSTDPRAETASNTSSAQGISGVKNVMSSLFSSLTDRVGGGSKQTNLSAQAPPVQASQPGLTKLFSFIPKSNSSAPVAIVSPVELSNEKSFSSFPSRQLRNSNMQVSNQGTKAPKMKPECAPENSVLRKFSPLKLFSAEDNGNSAEYKQFPESTTECGNTFEKLMFLSKERDTGQIHDRNEHNVPVSDPARSNHQAQSANTLLNPLKKSLSILMTPAVPVAAQGAPPVTVYPVFRSTEDLQREKPKEGSTLASKTKLPFLSSENLSTQQHPKAQGGVLSGFLKFASSEDVYTARNTQQHSVQSYHDSASTTATSCIETPVNLPQENRVKGWFSSTFNTTCAPSGSNLNFTSNHSQETKTPSVSQHISDQKPTATPRGMQKQPESQSFLAGLFKGSSAEDISHMGSNQPKQGGLISGLLKFGSISDSSGSLSQQAPHNNQPPRINNPPQQNYSAPQIGGVLSGQSKFSSLENIHHSDAEKQRTVPSNYFDQHQVLCEAQQTHPQQKGLFSGLIKFASSENIPTVQHQQKNQHYQEGLSQQNTQGPNKKPHLSNRTLNQDVVQRDTSKQSFTRQQTVPLQQPSSQRAAVLSGLFKFSSADNINAEQQPSSQQREITQSKSTHDQTRTNQQQNSSTQRTQLSGLLSGLFKSSSENMAQQQCEIIHETEQLNKVPIQKQMESANQSAVISGLFNKFKKKTSEDTTTQASATQPLHQKDNNNLITMKTPLQTQSCTYLTQLPSQEYAEKKKIPQIVQQISLSGQLSKHVTENTGTHKQREIKSQITEQQTPATKFTELHSGKMNNATSDLGMHNSQIVVPGCLNTRKSRHALFSTPVSIDTESLDLRTSATFARSLQSQATYSSSRSMACSTGNIHSIFENNTPSSSMAMQPPYGGSNHSLYEATRHGIYEGQWSPYGISPSYDENQWIRESALWLQFQNESINCHLEGENSLQASGLCCSSSNISPAFDSPTWQGAVCHQEQIGPYEFEGYRNDDPYYMKKLWNSNEDMANIEYSPNEDGALNLTTQQMNAKFGKLHSFNDGSTYSLNGVSYHECYYEETPPSLSYSANWQYGIDDAVQHNVHIDGMIHQSNFNLNKPMDSNCPLNASTDAEDSLYLEDTEWYQQWLALLEQGMWWAADDGDCGYFVYTDHEYIYALLTDAAGEYVYACVPEGESWGNASNLDTFPSAWLHNEMVLVCGFKIPLYNEDELLWLPGQDHTNYQLLNAPLDLSAAYRKGNQIMNLNLEQFSEMFENSFMSQGQQCVDFTSYKLNKVRMDGRQSSYVYEDQCKDVIDLSCHNKDHIGPYWNNQETKTFLAQKVAVSLNSTPTANSNQHILYSCYQPNQRRRSSTGITVKHVDDVSEEEWRKRVFPGEQQPNRQVKAISSLISSFVGKTSQVELNKTSTCSSFEVSDKRPNNIISSSFQTLKSKIIKEESVVVVSQPESGKDMQRSHTAQGRVLPTVPTTVQATHPSAQLHTTQQKPRLSRQTTMVQQSVSPMQPNIKMHSSSNESLIKPIQSGDLAAHKPVDQQSEQSQAGFMNFLKAAVGIEETKADHQKPTETSPKQQSKTGSTASLPESTAHKEATGVSNLFGSISSLFSTEPSPPQKQEIKPNVKEGLLTSTSRPKGIQRQQTMDQSGSCSTQSLPPNTSLSQVFSGSSSTGPATSQSETMPPTEQTKQETGYKPSGGLFGFSIGEMLTTAAQSAPKPQTPASSKAPQEESIGKSIFSIFSGSSPPQTTPKTELLSQVHPSSPQPSSQSKPTAEAQKQGTASPKPSSTGFLSMFASPTTQHSQAQTGSILGGILSGSASSKESPVKGLLSMFSDSTPPQSQPSTSSQQRVAKSQSQHGVPQTQSQPQALPQAQGQPATSVLGGILGLSASNESPEKALFSMFSGHSSPQTTGAGVSENMSSVPETAEPGNDILSIVNVMSPSPKTQNLSSAIVTAAKEIPAHHLQQGASQMSPIFTTTSESTDILGDKFISNSSEVHSSLPIDTTVDTTNTHTMSATSNGNDVASMEPNSESIFVQKKTSTESAAQDRASDNRPPASGLLSMISGSSSQTPSFQAGFSSDGPGKSLLSLFTGSSTETSATHTGHSPRDSAPGISDPKDSTKGLFSVFAGSASQPSSQPGSSLLGAVFGGSSTQIPPSQTGGSLLGGLFRGSAPQSTPQDNFNKGQGSTSQTAGPQTGASLIGGLFGSAPQAAGSPAGGSILGGIFGGSAASSTAAQNSGSFSGFFGGAANKSPSQNNSSILGAIFGVSSSQTGTEQSDVSVLGKILPEPSSSNEIPGKGLLSTYGGLVPPSTSTATTIPTSDHDKTALTTALTNTTPGVTILPKPNDDCKASSTLAHHEASGINTIIKSKEQAETLQQPNTAVHCLEASLTKTEGAVIEEFKCQDDAKLTARKSDESAICILAQQPATTEFVYGQSSQDALPCMVDKKTPVTMSLSPVVQGSEKPSEPGKNVGDSTADAVTGFMSSLFKSTPVPSDGPHQQQQNAPGLGGTASQAATSQTAGSLLGGIFGGSNTQQTAAPQTGGSLLGGFFKGATPQSCQQTPAPITGGSILGGMFGGGPSAKTVGSQTGGSLLGGIFGGSTATTHPGGSFLGGLLEGVTNQTAGSQMGTTVLGGIGGSLFGAGGQTPKTEPVTAEPRLTTNPSPQPKNDIVPSKVASPSTEAGLDKMVDSQTTRLPDNNQIKCESLINNKVMEACPETPTFSSGSMRTTCDLTHQVDNTAKENPSAEGEIIHEKSVIIKEDIESKGSDKTAPPDHQKADSNLSPQVNQLPHNAQPPQAKSLFGFMSAQSEAGKSFGSLFSPTVASSLPSVTQTEVGSGLFSGIKTLSGSLFKEEKTTSSLFGTKIGFPWQAEPPKPEAAPVVTSQTKTTDTSTGDQTHKVKEVATPGSQKHESVGSTDDIANPQICISSPEVDPSASLTPKEMESLVETYPSAGPTSGVQLDNQFKKDLLIAKRLVKA